MPDREMLQVKVSSSEGRIYIQQDSLLGVTEPDTIMLSPDQIEMLIAWLRKAKSELCV